MFYAQMRLYVSVFVSVCDVCVSLGMYKCVCISMCMCE